MPRKHQSVADFLNENTDLIDSNGNKISDWCTEGRNNFTAYCVYCKIFFHTDENDNPRTYHIMKHAKSVKHRMVCDIKKDSQNDLDDSLVDDVKSCSTSKVKPSTVKSVMNEYEMMLEEKRAKNREFLESLGIAEVKSDLIKDMKKKRVKRLREKPDPVVQRTSKRVKEQVDYAEELPTSADGLRQKFNPAETSFRKALKYNTSSYYANFVKDFSEMVKTDDIVVEDPVVYDKNIFKRLSPKASSMRVSGACAMSWLPSSENLVLAVGDGHGNLNLSKFKESYLDFHVFSVHSKGISHMQYNPCNPFNLISSSFDGKVLCCDMQAQRFTEVLSASERGCTYFDFIGPSSYIVSLTNGQVIILDSKEYNIRGSRYSEARSIPIIQKSVHSLHQYSIRTVNVHPVNKNYFVTTAVGEKNKICIWDIRHLTSPVITNTNHKKRVCSADFSPVSGNYLLSKALDEIGIFDCTGMIRRRMESLKTMKYNDTDTKKEECIRPVWLPNSDDSFAFSIKNSPLLHIFDKDLNIYETLPEDKPEVKKLIAFHPFQTALACATQSNKIYVYV